MSRERFHEAAMRIADWCVRNQVARSDSADHGRFPRWIHVGDKTMRYSTNWTTGTTLIGLVGKTRPGKTGRGTQLPATPAWWPSNSWTSTA